MITKKITGDINSSLIKYYFVEMLGHSSFHFQWDNPQKRFVAISADDAWDTFPNSEIAQIFIEEDDAPLCNHCGENHHYNECGWRDE